MSGHYVVLLNYGKAVGANDILTASDPFRDFAVEICEARVIGDLTKVLKRVMNSVKTSSLCLSEILQ